MKKVIFALLSATILLSALPGCNRNKPKSNENNQVVVNPNDKPGNNQGDKPGDKPGNPNDKPGNNQGDKPGDKPGNPNDKPGNNQGDKPGDKPGNPNEKPNDKPKEGNPDGGVFKLSGLTFIYQSEPVKSGKDEYVTYREYVFMEGGKIKVTYIQLKNGRKITEEFYEGSFVAKGTKVTIKYTDEEGEETYSLEGTLNQEKRNITLDRNEDDTENVVLSIKK
ncbi:MAG: hypothetical protein SPI35_03585 [Porphyromonas sp.]|nr:hypothetical protein [Porphyromonas sp.]